MVVSGLAAGATAVEGALILTSAGKPAFQAGTDFRGILDHANTADRTWTFPDKSGTVAMTTDVGGWTVVHKTEDENITTDDTLSNDSELSGITLAANNKWEYKLVVFFDTDAGGFKYRFIDDGASATVVNFMQTAFAGGSSTRSDAGVQSAFHSSDQALTGSGAGYILLEGIVHADAAVDVGPSFQWAQNVSHASTTKVRAGSYFAYRLVE